MYDRSIRNTFIIPSTSHFLLELVWLPHAAGPHKVTYRLGKFPDNAPGDHKDLLLHDILFAFSLIRCNVRAVEFLVLDDNGFHGTYARWLEDNEATLEEIQDWAKLPVTTDSLSRALRTTERYLQSAERQGDGWALCATLIHFFLVFLRSVQILEPDIIKPAATNRIVYGNGYVEQMTFRLWTKRFAANLANNLYKLGIYNRARQWIDLAIDGEWYEPHPTNRRADDEHVYLVRRGLIHAALRQYREAIADLESAVKSSWQCSHTTSVKDLAESLSSS